MTPDRFDEVERVCQMALDQPPNRREAVLDELCQDDPELRAEVESLLAGASNAAALMPVSAVALLAPTLSIGVRLGPYHLVEKIGEGGMGEVWVAEQREPIPRRVALKIVKAGMGTRNVLARFETERQALALMDHPGIAKVLDAGATPEGQPFFVMEYVKGEPITTYCDREQLSTEDRLTLFMHVCDAVQHAHQKGIIHRDLKPSNVLVTAVDGHAVAKIIDFGIAKATVQGLTERTVFTELGVLIGTPEYMSPEQAEMTSADVDTRTDVYSLGVMLYELLTGALPFDAAELRQAGLDEIRRRIREVDPPKPSARVSTTGDARVTVAHNRRTEPARLVSQLRRELDWITMKALEKRRDRRYASPSDLAAELERYLHNRPVEAGPPSAWYRTQKFVRRHRVGAAAAAFVTLSLAGATVATSLMYARSEVARREEHRQRLVAERRGCQAAMLAADFSLLAGSASGAQARLEDCTATLRGWEWQVLARRTSASAMTFELDGPSRKVAFQDDGTVRALVLGWKDGRRRLRVSSANLAHPAAAVTTESEESIIAVSVDNRLAVVTNATTTRWKAFSDPVTGFATLAAMETLDPRSPSAWFLQVRDVTNGRTVSRLDLEEVGRWTGPHLDRVGGREERTAGGWVPTLVDANMSKEIVRVGGVLPYLVDASFSPDGERVAAWSWANVIGVWHATSGCRVATLTGHTSGVTAVAFVPRTNRLVSASYDGTVRVWDLAESRQVAVLAVPPQAWAITVSPDGQWIAAGSGDGTIRVWDVARLALVWSAKSGTTAVRALAFTPDCRVLASAAGDNAIRLWDPGTGAGLASIRPHRGSTNALSFSADGLRLASVGDDNTLRVTNLADADMRVLVPPGPPVTAMVFAPDSATLLTAASDGAMRAWQTETGRLLRTMEAPKPIETRGPGQHWTRLALSPDGRLLAGGFAEDITVCIWDTASGERMHTLSGERARNLFDKDKDVGFETLAFTGDSSRLIAGASWLGGVLAWDLSTGRIVDRVIPGTRVPLLVPFRDGRHMLFVADSLWIEDRVSLRLLDALTLKVEPVLAAVDGFTDCVAVDSAESHILVGTGRGALSVLDLRGGAPLTVLKPSGSNVTSCVYSPNGQRIAAAFGDGTIGVWDSSTNEQMLSLTVDVAFAGVKTGIQPSAEIGSVIHATSLAFSADGAKLASAWSDGAVRIWNGAFKSVTQRARDMVDGRFDRTEFADDVAGALDAEPGLSSQMRAEAVRQARSHVDDPSALHYAAWNVVAVPTNDAAAYARALRQAQKASAMTPSSENLVTLALAQVRVGQFRDAVRTTALAAEKSADPHQKDLVVVRVLAMLHMRELDAVKKDLDLLIADASKTQQAYLKSLIAEAQTLAAQLQRKK